MVNAQFKDLSERLDSIEVLDFDGLPLGSGIKINSRNNFSVDIYQVNQQRGSMCEKQIAIKENRNHIGGCYTFEYKFNMFTFSRKVEFMMFIILQIS